LSAGEQREVAMCIVIAFLFPQRLIFFLENKSPKQKEVYNLAPLIDYPKRYTLYPSSAAIVVAYLLGA